MPPFAEIDVCVASHLTTAPPGYCRGCTVKRGSRGITYSCAYTTNPKGSPLASPSHPAPSGPGLWAKEEGLGGKRGCVSWQCHLRYRRRLLSWPLPRHLQHRRRRGLQERAREKLERWRVLRD